MKRLAFPCLSLLLVSACTEPVARTSAPTSDSPDALSGTISGAHSSSAATIQVVDLGTLPGGYPSAAQAISGRVIVGSSYTGANGTGAQHAVRWQESTLGNGIWVIADLAVYLAGSTSSEATALNAAGDVAGWMQGTTGERAFLLAAGQVTVIDPPTGSLYTRATGVSTAGEVVGNTWGAPAADGSIRDRAFYYAAGSVVELPTLSGNSEANAITTINGATTVIGYSVDASGAQHAVVWTNSSGSWTIARMAGTVNATSEQNAAEAVNVNGRIAGVGCPQITSTGCSSGSRAYRWNNATTAPSTLGTLGGKVSTAYGINEVGDLAGWSTTRVGTKRAIFSAQGSTVLTDLGSLGGRSGSSTAAGIAGKLIVGSSAMSSGSAPPVHAALWIVP